MKIFLIGFPGCGKSFLGKQLAAALKISFLDTDEITEESAGLKINEIFRTKGEEYFRNLEADELRKTFALKDAVIATGGGLPCYHDNMKWMNENGLTLYLEASAAFLFHRLVREKITRPLMSRLSDIELMIYITETLATRKSCYEKAKHKFDAESATGSKLARFVKEKLLS